MPNTDYNAQDRSRIIRRQLQAHKTGWQNHQFEMASCLNCEFDTLHRIFEGRPDMMMCLTCGIA